MSTELKLILGVLLWLPLRVFALEFELPDSENNWHTLSEWQGKPTFVFVWKSDCLSCQQELPEIKAFAQKSSDANLILITIDSWQDSSPKLIDLPHSVQRLRAVNPENLLKRMGNKVGAVPYTLILDSHHEVCQKHLGALTESTLFDALSHCQL